MAEVDQSAPVQPMEPEKLVESLWQKLKDTMAQSENTFGMEVVETTYLFSLPNTYLYSGFLVHTLDMFFRCRVKDESRLGAMDDVADAFWVPLQEVNPEEFGLDSVREGVKRFLKENNITK